ncbi:MAG TPA: ribonuclease E/G [Deltaproteobacteria bacterium]|nr:ribonuclease E/G [Deltaproteobacteria bacterium]HPJ92272.1 ribonuclease E/G [Deltaproteobacteria bacterium]
MKKMLINAIHPEEIRVAVVENNILKELHIESALKEQLRGNVFRGKISKVEKSLDAVFVDYGREKHGLLPIGDINPAFIPGAQPEKDRKSLLRKGLEIPVQVSREEKSSKGALLTMNLSIPGRYMVLIPRQELAGISRKIEDEVQRKRLKDIIKQLKLPNDMGLIVRTAGMDKTKAELSKDINYLIRLWKSMELQFLKAPCPSMIYREGDIIIRSIRDYFTTDMTEILIDEEETYKRATIFMKSVMPRYKSRIKYYKQAKPLFTKYDLEQQIKGIYDKKVKLKSGGTIVIEPTEAMVVIDVNSGQSRSSTNIEDTAFSTNMEAASEIARQLVLRDIGGLVVIDFIDMRTKEHIRKVEKALKDGLKEDRAHLVIGKISKFGIMELSREKLSSTLLEKSYVSCPECDGTGMVRSVESSAFMALREIQLYINRHKSKSIRVGLPKDVALYLLNQQRKYLVRLEQEFSTEIGIYTLDGLRHGQIQIDQQEQMSF